MFPFSHLALAEAPLAGHPVLSHGEVATCPSSQSHLQGSRRQHHSTLWARGVARVPRNGCTCTRRCRPGTCWSRTVCMLPLWQVPFLSPFHILDQYLDWRTPPSHGVGYEVAVRGLRCTRACCRTVPLGRSARRNRQTHVRAYSGTTRTVSPHEQLRCRWSRMTPGRLSWSAVFEL